MLLSQGSAKWCLLSYGSCIFSFRVLLRFYKTILMVYRELLLWISMIVFGWQIPKLWKILRSSNRTQSLLMHIFDHGNTFFLIYQLALFFIFRKNFLYTCLLFLKYIPYKGTIHYYVHVFFSLFLVIGWLYSLLAPSEWNTGRLLCGTCGALWKYVCSRC